MNRLPIVKLLTRPGCEACNRGKFILRRLKNHVDFTAKVVNIAKEQQYSTYNDYLPAILVEEKLICKTKIVERDLREAILKETERLGEGR
jgi:hypothetical protein